MSIDQTNAALQKETAPCAQTHGADKRNYPSRKNIMVFQTVAGILTHRRWLLALPLALIAERVMP
ncbi:hypothetical protein EHS17_14385 [Rhodobacteraceae bacterium CH30]|nr:hypothetical protein EHS17_14385 [Rhodobacteraceae bacterium CH30]